MPRQNDKMTYLKVGSKEELSIEGIKRTPSKTIDKNTLGEGPWLLGEFDLISYLDGNETPWVPLTAYCEALIGSLTGMDEAFVVSKQVVHDEALELNILFPYALRGAEVFRYKTVNPDNYLIYPYDEGNDGKPVLIQEKRLKTEFPNIYNHLLQRKSNLQKRKDSRKYYATGPDWYRLVRPGSYNTIHPSKLIIKGIDIHITTGLLGPNSAFNGANCPGIIVSESSGLHPNFFLALLNSSLIAYYLRSVCPPKLNGYRRYNATNLSRIPIRSIDLSIQRINTIYSEIVSFASLAVSMGDAKPTTTQEKVQLERAIKAIDSKIDQLVYELYGLTKNEVKVIESI